METITKKRSVALTDTEKIQLKAYRDQYETEVACAATIGIDRNVLARVMLTGSGAPDTIAKIKKVIAGKRSKKG